MARHTVWGVYKHNAAFTFVHSPGLGPLNKQTDREKLVDRFHKQHCDSHASALEATHKLHLHIMSQGPSNAMTSSEERTSAESESSRLIHREVTDGLLRPTSRSVLEQILGREVFS